MTLFEYNKYPQMPTMHVQSPLEADWDKHNEVVPQKFIRKSIRDKLYETMKDELDIKEDGHHMVSDKRFNNYLYTIEHN